MHKIITQEEAKRIMDTQSCVVLDVRTEEEFVLGHIENSVNIPVDDLSARISELPDKNALILVCCRSGRRSAIAAEVLLKNGFTHVLDFGGLLEWRYGYVEWD